MTYELLNLAFDCREQTTKVKCSSLAASKVVKAGLARSVKFSRNLPL